MVYRKNLASEGNMKGWVCGYVWVWVCLRMSGSFNMGSLKNCPKENVI